MQFCVRLIKYITFTEAIICFRDCSLTVGVRDMAKYHITIVL